MRWLSLHRLSAQLLGHRIPIAIPVLALLVCMSALWALWPTTILEIRAGQDGQMVKIIPVTTGQWITYTYFHSVQKKPIDEMLEVAPNGHLVVRETVYEMTGAGLPSDVLDGDFKIDPKDGKFHIVNMSRDVPVFRVRVAFTAEQTLEVGAQKFRLDSLATPMTLLVIDVVSRPRILTWHSTTS